MAVPQSLTDWVTNFFRMSDIPDHDAFMQLWTPEARMLIGDRKANNRDEILKMRLAGWDKVANRVHRHEKIYINDQEPDVALVTGTIDLDRLEDGEIIRNLEWSARMKFKDGKLDDYKVWVVSLLQPRTLDLR